MKIPFKLASKPLGGDRPRQGGHVRIQMPSGLQLPIHVKAQGQLSDATYGMAGTLPFTMAGPTE